ncbi:MAG: hypothetical protein HY079_10985 [Elusimicrobia bacterium]|nr:hypothetical protein [Elusimicrobiota bacterium]
MIARLLLGVLLASLPGLAAAGGAAAPAAEKAVRIHLHIGARARRHILSEHFRSGTRAAGKSLFRDGEDLDALVALAAAAPAKRERNGRDKRVVDCGRAIGTDGRTGRPVRTLVVIAEPDGEVVTAYPGR